MGNRHGYLVEATVGAAVDIEAGEAPDRGARGQARRPVHQRRNQPMEVVARGQALGVGYAVDRHPEAVASDVLSALDRGLELADAACGGLCPPFGCVQRAPEAVLVVLVGPAEPWSPMSSTSRSTARPVAT